MFTVAGPECVAVHSPTLSLFLCVSVQEVAMSGILLTFSEDRAKAVDFSQPLYKDTQTLVYKRPEIQADLSGFLKPYTTPVKIKSSV